MQQMTKKKGFAWGGILLVLGAWALPACAAPQSNAIEMVTFFPVQYAKYPQLTTGTKLDIGTVFNEDFTLELSSFLAKEVYLSYHDTNENISPTTLKMSTNFETETATFGNITKVSEDATTLINFHDVYIDKITGDNLSIKIKKSALTGTSLSNFKVFGKTLPACNGEVRWKSIDASKKCYLVCCPSSSCSSLRDCAE